MKLSEKVLSAIATITVGVLLICMRGHMIGVVASVFGIALVVAGVMDFIAKDTLQGGIKVAIGVLAVVFGWVLLDIVVYLAAAGLVVFGVFGIYHEVKWGMPFRWEYVSVVHYGKYFLCTLIGILLFFNFFEWMFIVAGAVTVVEGCVMLVDGLKNN